MKDTEKEDVKENETSSTETTSNEATSPDGDSSENVAPEAPKEEKKEPTPEEKIAELEKANAELKDQYLRKCADFDNYRKRMIREKQDAFDFANTNLLTDLITILDDFDRALVAGKSTDEKAVVDLKPVVDGISMINKQLRSMLENKYNLTAYGNAGDVFNHDLHEAIGSAQAPVAEPVCAEVYLKGYKLKERVIRPAKVMVNMPDGSCEKKDDEPTEDK